MFTLWARVAQAIARQRAAALPEMQVAVLEQATNEANADKEGPKLMRRARVFKYPHIVGQDRVRDIIISAYDSECQYCGGVFESHNLHVDHIEPRINGGPSSLLNFTLSCAKCNRHKRSNELPEDVRVRVTSGAQLKLAMVLAALEPVEREPAEDKPFVNFSIDPKLLKRIDEYWRKNGFMNRAAAIKWLLTWALDQKPKPEDAIPPKTK